MAPSIAPRHAALVRRFTHRSTPTAAAMAALKWLHDTRPRPVLALVPLRVYRTTCGR